MNGPDKYELAAIYHNRFDEQLEYRKRVWSVLCAGFWQQFIADDADVLDLSCGYGEFINQIRCGKKWAMDLNPVARQHLASDVTFLEQDCSAEWQLPDNSLDVVFTSNFFEHLPDKPTLARTLRHALRCLRKDGTLIVMGPNIRYVPGEYWDFYDHYLPLTDKSLAEGLRAMGFKIQKQVARFLPYTMAGRSVFPRWVIATYLRLPILWRFFGKQFLVIARKTAG